jgi:hypothetical protein
MKKEDCKYQNINFVTLKKRSFLGRLKRLPTLILTNWRFANECNFIDRVSFCFSMIKAVMK